MIWNEIKMVGYDFSIQSGKYQVRRRGEQFGLYYYDHRIGWCENVEDGMFKAWTLELKGKRKNE